MALTQRVIFNSYPFNGEGKQDTGVMGVTQNLPSALTRFYTAPAGTTAGNSITISSIVELLPVGLNQQPKKFYTDSTTTQLGSNGS